MIVVSPEVVDFASSRLGYPLVAPFSVMGSTQGGKVVAAMVFTHLSGPDIHVTVAADGNLPRELIRAAGRYVFGQLGCIRATLITESSKVLEYGKRLGAETEGVAKHQYGEGRHGHRLAFFKSDWRH